MKKFIAGITALLMVVMGCAGCSDGSSEVTKTDVAETVSNEPVQKEGGVPENNEVSNNTNGTRMLRNVRSKYVPMGEDGTWTVFVYVCGTDLETDGGMASMDIQEMKQVSGNSDIKFILQTGGTKSWTEDINANATERYEICDGKMTLLESNSYEDMGESRTLSDFLDWGISNYSAARMGLILWNHGSGSINGVCFDESSDNSLSLRELDAALYNVHDKMTDSFEFIGFDACLMGTVETAAVLASHAKYMVASQEVEPGYGWNYTELGNYLSKNPQADGLELGRAICDSYYNDCAAIGSEDQATLAVIDLSKIDNVINTFDAFAEELYNATEDKNNFSDFARNVSNAETFGYNSKSEGYMNMVDMAGIIDAGANITTLSANVKQAINEAVAYSKNGYLHGSACGMAMYYPLKVSGSEELSIFKDICISTYYLALVDRVAYGAANSGEIESYDNSEILNNTISWTSDYLESGDDGYYYEEASDDSWSYLEDYEVTGASASITFDVAPHLDEDGNYIFKLSEEGLINAASVQSTVYLISEDMVDIIELGLSSDVVSDWQTGEFYDNFDGLWFCLPDGQMLAVYLFEENDGYDVFTSPVVVNDEETNLRFVWDYENETISLLGTWDGMNENGSASREIKSLSTGDVIIPRYYSYAIESDDEDTYYGKEYVFDGDPEIYFDYMPDGYYLYGFWIDDIYGDYYLTDYINFTIDGDDITFNDLK